MSNANNVRSQPDTKVANEDEDIKKARSIKAAWHGSRANNKKRRFRYDVKEAFFQEMS